MKIGLDCQSITGYASGLGQYTNNLIRRLPQAASQNDYYLFRCSKNFRGKTYERLIWENMTLPSKAFSQKLDILHVPAFSAPFIKQVARKMVVTVHDLIGVVFPQHLSFTSRFYWSKWLPFTNKKADFIIADSEWTKNDIIRYMNFDPKKIRVIPLAVDEKFSVRKSEVELASVCQKYSLKRPFIFFLGNVEPRKNLPRLIRAFKQLKTTQKIEHDLVIGGSRSWPYPELQDLYEKSGIADSVRFIDYVDEGDLTALYQASDLFVFPSLYEGFGFPVLEAMTCGVPVITSNVSSIPEVGQNAVYYVDPCNEEELAKAISSVIHDRNLWRQLQEKGYEQARRFSWKRTVEETLQVYEDVNR